LLVCPNDAGGDLAASSGDLLHRRGIRENRNGLQKALPFLGRHENACRDAIARDLDGLAALFDPPKQLEKRILGLGRGHGAHG
jgi:hypothetical protein